MDWLFDNPLANMYGPYFLLLYGLVILLSIIFIHFFAEKLISIKDISSSKIPANPDPYEVAYLRGGAKEVVKLIIYNLLSKNFLKSYSKPDRSKVIVQKVNKHPSVLSLNPIDREVFKLFTMPSMELKQFMFSDKVINTVEDECDKFKKSWETFGYLSITEHVKKFDRLKANTIGVVLFFGAYKLLAAFSHGHSNVIFMIILGILGISIISGFRLDSVTTNSGKKYLEDLEKAFKPKTEKEIDHLRYEQKFMLIGVLGFSHFAHTPFGFLEQYAGKVRPKNSVISGWWNNWSPGTGGSCGSSCSSGSSCGSGCGSGCGGGCGGCGG